MKRIILALFALCVFTAPLHAAEVQVQGLKVHYTVQGTGPAMIFVHGWTCDETSWRLQVPAFAGAHRVITLDLPGHGKSQVPAQDKFSMELFAAAVEAVRVDGGAGKVVLVGHSMGAAVIGQYAMRYPEHVAGLVAADGSLVAVGGTRPGGPFSMSPQQRENMIAGMFTTSTPPTLRTEIRKMMLGAPEVTANGAMAAMFDPANRSDKTIDAPALSIFAGSSAPGRDQNTRQVIPKWESTVMAGTGHFLMMEKPEEFNRLLAGFIKDRASY